MKDSEERKRVEEFKMKNRNTQKRLRTTRSSPEEEISKGALEPRSKRLKRDVKWLENDIDLGDWLEMTEARYQDVQTLPEGWTYKDECGTEDIASTSGGVDISTAESNENSPEDKDVLPAGWKDKENMKSGTGDHATAGGGEYNLHGLIGWWRRLEKGEEPFWNECRRKQKEKLMRKTTTLSFIQKFYPAANVENNRRVSLNETLPKVNMRTENRTVALNTEQSFNKKQKIDISLPQVGSPNKIQKIKNNFSSTQQYWLNKQRSTESKYGTDQSLNQLGPGGRSSVNLEKQTKGSGGM